MKTYFYLGVLGTALVMLSGCATSKFRPYSGAQQDWPTSPGSFIETNSTIPTYFGLPPKPYEVLGYLDATTAPIRRSGVVSYAASRAKALGGDAIIVLREGSEYAGTFNFGSAKSLFENSKKANKYAEKAVLLAPLVAVRLGCDTQLI